MEHLQHSVGLLLILPELERSVDLAEHIARRSLTGLGAEMTPVSRGLIQEGATLSGTQVRNIQRVLHNALSYAVRLGYIARNPTEAIDKPRDDTEERTVYTPDQTRRFLLAIEGDRLQAMWYLVLSTGLRRAELAGLRWRDVGLDRDPPLLAVRTTRTTAGQVVVEHDPKSRSSRRVLHLDTGTADALRAQREAMSAEAEQRGEFAVPEYVFVDEFGGPFHPARLTRDLLALQRRAGLPNHPA